MDCRLPNYFLFAYCPWRLDGHGGHIETGKTVYADDVAQTIRGTSMTDLSTVQTSVKKSWFKK